MSARERGRRGRGGAVWIVKDAAQFEHLLDPKRLRPGAVVAVTGKDDVAVMLPRRRHPHTDLVNACLEYLLRRGFFVWPNPTGRVKNAEGRWLRYGKKGSADILGIGRGGRFLAVECKTGRGVLSEDQEAFRDEVLAHDGEYLVVRAIEELEVWARPRGERA